MGTFEITSYCQEVLQSAVSSSSLFPRWVRTSNNESANLDDDIENIQNVRIGDRSDASFIHRTLSRRSGYKTIPFELRMPFMTLTWQQNIIHSVVEHKMNWFSNTRFLMRVGQPKILISSHLVHTDRHSDKRTHYNIPEFWYRPTLAVPLSSKSVYYLQAYKWMTNAVNGPRSSARWYWNSSRRRAVSSPPRGRHTREPYRNGK